MGPKLHAITYFKTRFLVKRYSVLSSREHNYSQPWIVVAKALKNMIGQWPDPDCARFLGLKMR